jgi:hypothetical protein
VKIREDSPRDLDIKMIKEDERLVQGVRPTQSVICALEIGQPKVGDTTPGFIEMAAQTLQILMDKGRKLGRGHTTQGRENGADQCVEFSCEPGHGGA